MLSPEISCILSKTSAEIGLCLFRIFDIAPWVIPNALAKALSLLTDIAKLIASSKGTGSYDSNSYNGLGIFIGLNIGNLNPYYVPNATFRW
jgi:hypothetical protein